MCESMAPGSGDVTREDEALTEDDQEDQATRTHSRRAVVGAVLTVVLALVLATASAGAWLVHSLSSNVESLGNPFSALPSRAATQTAADGEDPAVNLLVLGSDSRISAGDPSEWKAGAQRTDSMMIVQISGDRKSVSIMSIPRDSWVPIPGHGTAKINAAYSWGGPTLTIETVEQLTNIHIDHFVIADFNSFSQMTDELGGVTINLNHEQKLAGTEFGTGAQKLTGAQALAYVRERYSLPNGDFDRIKRQQTWMRAIISQIHANGTLKSPTKLYSFMKVASSSVSADDGFDFDTMTSLASSLKDVGNNISFFTAPVSGTGTSSDGQSIVNLDAEADAPIFAAFAEGKGAEYIAEHPDAVEILPTVVN